jgi:predicted acylesterase/phospholipase RssA
MAKKLAITIAGAVSLGSYESGVAFEVLDALTQHNHWADANDLPDERFEIDVLTGASAGGMTSAMIAQRLLYDGPSMSEPYNNRERYTNPIL